MPELVLVTGASGFLGRYAARAWSRAGCRVVGIGRKPWREPEWRAWGLSEWLCADISQESLTAFAGIPDVIVHCAGGGSVGYSILDPAGDFNATVGSLVLVLEHIRLRAPNARLVYPSSAAVYGLVERLPINEEEDLRPTSPYGVNKRVAEQLCRSYGNHFGLKVALVRFFSLYGPFLRKQLLWDACCRFSKGEAGFHGSGEEVRDWLQVQDAVDLLRVAAEHAEITCPIVNGAMGSGAKVRDVLRQLREAFPKAPPLVFSAKAKIGDPPAQVGDCEKALSWGWRPQTDLASGLASYVSWFQGVRL